MPITKWIVLLLFPTITTYAQEVEVLEIESQRENYFFLANPSSEKLSSDEIGAKNLFHAEELWDQFSNLNTSSGTNRIRYIKIRGIGERSEYDTVPSNSVGVFYDHIDLSGLSGVLATYDVENVEVLKGPQTFLYGDSSLGGNILFRSSSVFENKTALWTDIGSQNHRLFGAKGNYQISENFSIKVGAQKNDSDGFFYNNYFNDHTSSRDELFASFGTQYEFGNSILKTSHIVADQKNGNDVWNTDGSFLVSSDKYGKDNQFTHGHSIELNGPLTSDMKYMAMVSYSYSDIINSYDEDWGNNDYWNTVPGWNKNYDYFKYYNRRKYNLHSKFILQNQIENLTLSYGLHYYQKIETSYIDSLRNSLLRNHLDSRFVADKFALLLNASYPLTQSLTIHGSARAEKQFIDYSDSNLFKSKLENDPYAFNLLLTQNLGAHSLNWIVSRGFKGAGFNPDINLTTDQQSYDPEYAMNYEFSWTYQNTWWTNNVSVFYLDRRDHQITTSTQNDPTDPSNFTFFIDNAARSEHYGLEWDADILTNQPLSFNMSLGLLKAHFKDYYLQNKSYKDRDLAHTPHYTFSVGLLWKIIRDLSFSANVTGKDKFYFSNTHDEESKAFTLFHSSLHYQLTQQWKFSLWGKNIFNQRYSQRGFYFANEPPQWISRSYTQNGSPLEWGVRISYTF